MMQRMVQVTETTKIKNGSVVLPRELRATWKDAEVFLRSSDDTIVIKKMQKAPFWNTWKKLGALKTKINRKDIDDAITWARRRSK